MMQRILVALCLKLATGSLVHAQLFFFENPGKPLTADITATMTARTPWGVVTQVETGKYWRGKKDLIRQDNAHGNSIVASLRNPRSTAQIDHELKLITAWREPVSANFATTGRFGQDPTIGGPFLAKPKWGNPYLKVTGQQVVEGFKVTIRKGLGQAGLFVETWWSDELRLMVLAKYITDTVEFEQRFHNIQRTEPDTSVFEFPLGFKIHSWEQGIPAAPCFRFSDGITGEKERTTYRRAIWLRADCQ